MHAYAAAHVCVCVCLVNMARGVYSSYSRCKQQLMWNSPTCVQHKHKHTRSRTSGRHTRCVDPLNTIALLYGISGEMVAVEQLAFGCVCVCVVLVCMHIIQKSRDDDDDGNEADDGDDDLAFACNYTWDIRRSVLIGILKDIYPTHEHTTQHTSTQTPNSAS